MNNCTDSDIQEMLPDLLHGALANDERLRVEAHLATCESCQEDLDVLRTVKSAAVFAPSIDVDRVVRQIPPYRAIVPATERPDLPATERSTRTRLVSWLVAASLALVVVGGGSVLIQSNGAPRLGSTAPRPVVATTIPKSSGAIASASTEPVVVTKVEESSTIAARPHALALAAEADGLSDGNLVQLMNDMDRFDALPAAEPDPVISVSVDSGDSL
jgi:anti-sigma factor RsiW